LANEIGCHNRTVIRAAKRLGIPTGKPLSDEDRLRITLSSLKNVLDYGPRLRYRPPKGGPMKTILGKPAKTIIPDPKLWPHFRGVAVKRGQKVDEAIDEAMRLYIEKYNHSKEE